MVWPPIVIALHMQLGLMQRDMGLKINSDAVGKMNLRLAVATTYKNYHHSMVRGSEEKFRFIALEHAAQSIVGLNDFCAGIKVFKMYIGEFITLVKALKEMQELSRELLVQ